MKSLFLIGGGSTTALVGCLDVPLFAALFCGLALWAVCEVVS